MKKTKNIQDVIDLSENGILKSISEFNSFKNNNYTNETNDITKRLSEIQSGNNSVNKKNNSAYNNITKLQSEKADKDKIMKKESEGVYTSLLPSDTILEKEANVTGFSQNILYSGVFDLSNPKNMLLNGKNRNFFHSEDMGKSSTIIDFNTLPDYIKNENFQFTGVANVDGKAIKGVAWYYEATYGRCLIFITTDMKNWVFDQLLHRTDATNRIMKQGNKIFFKCGNCTYWWATENYTAVWSRDIDKEDAKWIQHWNISCGANRTSNDIPKPKVNQYGQDGIRFATIFKFKDTWYDVLYYDRNNHYKKYPDPESYQIWIKPVGKNSVLTINIGTIFTAVNSGAVIVIENYVYILASQTSPRIYKVDCTSWKLIETINPNLPAFGNGEITTDNTYFYFRLNKLTKRVKYDGSTNDEIYFYNKVGNKINPSSCQFLWAGHNYILAMDGKELNFYKYENKSFKYFKTIENPSPTVDINKATNSNSDLYIQDSLGNKRISSNNGKKWTATKKWVSSKDSWIIPFKTDNDEILKGDKFIWGGLSIYHYRNGKLLKKYTIPRQDYILTQRLDLNPNTKRIDRILVGKNGNIVVNSFYRNKINTYTHNSLIFFDSVDKLENKDVWNSNNFFQLSWTIMNAHFYYNRNYFDSYHKCLYSGTNHCILIDFREKKITRVNGVIGFSGKDYTVSNNNFAININEFTKRIGGKDVGIITKDSNIYTINLPDMPKGIFIQRIPKYIKGYFFLFYVNGMAYFAHENDILSDYKTAFKKLKTGIYGKLNDIAYNGKIWIAAGDKGSLSFSYDLKSWFGYEISRYSTPDNNDLGFDIFKNLETKETESFDFLIGGTPRIKFTVNGYIKTSITGNGNKVIGINNTKIEPVTKIETNEYHELNILKKDVVYEKLNFDSIETINSNNLIGYIPYNWKGNFLAVEGKVKNISSKSNMNLKLLYNDEKNNQSITIWKFPQTWGNEWKNFRDVIKLPDNWSKNKDWGYSYNTSNKNKIKGMALSIESPSGKGWEIKDLSFDLGIINRPLEFKTIDRDNFLATIPYSWRGYKVKYEYDIKNDGAVAPSSICIYYKDLPKDGNNYHWWNRAKRSAKDTKNWTHSSVEITLPYRWNKNNKWRLNNLYPYYSNYLGLIFFVQTETSYGSANAWRFKNFKAKLIKNKNTYNDIKNNKLTFNYLSKYTFNEITNLKSIFDIE